MAVRLSEILIGTRLSDVSVGTRLSDIPETPRVADIEPAEVAIQEPPFPAFEAPADPKDISPPVVEPKRPLQFEAAPKRGFF